MTQVIYIIAAMSVGVGSALQVGLVASMGRLRGPTEAAWINVLGTFGAMALIFGVQSLRSDPPNLPAPFNTIAPFAAAAILASVGLAICIRGLDPYFAIAGLFGFLYLFGAGYLAPRIGIALFASAVTAGTLTASVGLDHIGAFGGDIHRANLVRLLGLAALILGVVLVRSGR